MTLTNRQETLNSQDSRLTHHRTSSRTTASMHRQMCDPLHLQRSPRISQLGASESLTEPPPTGWAGWAGLAGHACRRTVKTSRCPIQLAEALLSTLTCATNASDCVFLAALLHPGSRTVCLYATPRTIRSEGARKHGHRRRARAAKPPGRQHLRSACLQLQRWPFFGFRAVLHVCVRRKSGVLHVRKGGLNK